MMAIRNSIRALRHHLRDVVRFCFVTILALAGLLVTACGDDGFDRALLLDKNAGQGLLLTVMQDLVPDGPVPGNGGIITLVKIAGVSVHLAWTEGTDEKTPQESLRYKVVYSTRNNIANVTDAELNGTVSMDWTADRDHHTTGSLDPATTYFINVLVMDGDGNKAAYTPIAVMTQGNGLVLYSAGIFTGALQGDGPESSSVITTRDRLDALCTAAKPSTVAGTNVRAFISISNSDAITAMAETYGLPVAVPVVGPTGMQIAANWSALMAGTLVASLNSAGVANNFWWSGYAPSSSDPGATTCSGWSDATNASKGIVGATNRTDIQWLSSNDSNCNNSRHLLCVSWQD